MKILIIDDNDQNQYMLRALLEGHKHQVIEAPNGKEALDLLTHEAVDLIISDILMPVMDGFALCREIKNSSTMLHIPFIIYTATYTGPQDETLAMELGADCFLIKPCEPDIMLEKIAEVMERASKANPDRFTSGYSNEEVLKLYNERLVRKLEQKMLQTEEEIQAHLQTLKALKRSEELLNATQSISRIGGWEWDLAKQKMYWTKETFIIHDIDEEAFQGESQDFIALSLKCYPEIESNIIREAFENCIATGEPYELDAPFTTCKGRKLYIRTSGKAVKENGKIVKVLGYIQDVTEHKLAELEQNELKEQLRQAQKLESIGQLAGGVAHDFNNNLTVILGYSEEILYSLKSNDPLEHDIKEIVKAGHRALNLTQKLLTFSQKQVVQPQVIHLNSVILEMKQIVNRLIGEDIVIETDLAPDLFCIKADNNQLDQVTLNLIINARDAMPEGGTLTIATNNCLIDDSFKHEQLSIPSGQYVKLIFKDTGCGMSKEVMDRIFEPFFTTKSKSKGTGLGLSIVYGIVKQFNGYIWVDSTPKAGTTFTILFEATEEKKTIYVEEPQILSIMGNGEHILLVDDDAHIRKMTHRMLSTMNYQVTLASSAEEALDLIQKQHLEPDLLITDVVMPGMNGKELTDKAKVLLPKTSFLYISGYTDNIINQYGVLDVGIPVIQKPFTKDVLSMHIRQQLNKDVAFVHPVINILMIDDDEDIIKLFTRLFEKRGHHCIGVNSYDKAKEILKEQSINFLIVDLNLVMEDGIEVIDKFRKSGYHIPAIILTGALAMVDMDKIKQIGDVYALEKSFDNLPLLNMVEAIVEAKKKD
jgi:CheY-like chemotaxis protein